MMMETLQCFNYIYLGQKGCIELIAKFALLNFNNTIFVVLPNSSVYPGMLLVVQELTASKISILLRNIANFLIAHSAI